MINADLPTKERRFIDPSLDPANLEQLLPHYERLLERELPDVAALEDWLLDYSELAAVVGERGARTRIAQACHTDDAEIERAFLHWVEKVSPAISPYGDKLSRKYLEAPGRDALEKSDAKYALMGKSWATGVEIFRKENIPLFTEVTKLNAAYDKLNGAMLIEYDGKEQTLQQLARYQEEISREVRQETWELSTNRRLQDREEIDRLFDEMLAKRKAIAENAGLGDYRAYTWKHMERFDYSPEDCLDFAEAIEAVCVPAVRALDEARRAKLGVDTLRPWDGSVDVEGRGPLRPFDADDPMALVRGGLEIFGKVHPMLSEQFAKLKDGRNLDLKSRKGKRAGGFQSSLQDSKEPFIFMNAAGVQRDVDTLLHEGGHAFHYQWASASEPLAFLHHAPIEFCEVASMGMELLACDHYGVFYPDDALAAARAKRKQLEGVLRVLPWIATIDSFQHWIYTNPGHTAEQRTAAWLDIFGRFGSSAVDYTGFEDAKASRWHAQLHLFHHPFYYVEYGIAQLGALQLWQNFAKDPDQTLKQYREALTLGGTRPLPELFDACGLKLDFTRKTLEPLIEALMAELEALPA
ncbi:MAG: M3 family oligoendopeptidase [Planctomycetota bacterium]